MSSNAQRTLADVELDLSDALRCKTGGMLEIGRLLNEAKDLVEHGQWLSWLRRYTALLVLRHGAFPIALNDAMWQKYKIGESLEINDPETKAPAVKNPFYKPQSGVLPIDDMALDRLLAPNSHSYNLS